MSVYNKITAHDKAIELVKAALESGSIKLHGSVTTTAKASSDAAYLSTLIKSVAESLTERSN